MQAKFGENGNLVFEVVVETAGLWAINFPVGSGRGHGRADSEGRLIGVLYLVRKSKRHLRAELINKANHALSKGTDLVLWFILD